MNGNCLKFSNTFIKEKAPPLAGQIVKFNDIAIVHINEYDQAVIAGLIINKKGKGHKKYWGWALYLNARTAIKIVAQYTNGLFLITSTAKISVKIIPKIVINFKYVNGIYCEKDPNAKYDN